MRTRSPAYLARDREKSRNRYRVRAGIPLDAPLAATGAGRFREPTWQCRRCTEPHAPGSDLCADHLQTMAELELGRRRTS